MKPSAHFRSTDGDAMAEVSAIWHRVLKGIARFLALAIDCITCREDAPPVGESLVCNIGDMLHRMTAGLYPNTPDRVRLSTNQGNSRGATAP